jgi:general secretion pathway protein N
MGWLEGNLVGRILAGIAAGLVVISLLLGVIWSLPPAGSDGDAEGAGDAPRPAVPQLPESEPIEHYAVVTERPVFNESRQPELELDLADEGEGELPQTEVEAPELELAGVVITPSIRMVTLRQTKEAGQSLVAFEGQPLHGDYGSWHVSRIEPREITLASGNGEELQLKLEVHDAKIAPPPKAKPQPAAEQPSAAQQAAAGSGARGDEEPLSRAEEIRQRIQERREELRRAAEEDAASGQEQAADYRRAIQSMIGERKDQAATEDEQ